MRVSYPCSCPGPSPSALGNITQIMVLGLSPRPANRPVEANAYRRAGCERDQGRAHLTVYIDHQLITGPPQSRQQSYQLCSGAPAAANSRELLPIEEHDPGESRVMLHQLCVFRSDEPVDLRMGETESQFRQQRNGMYDVAQRRRLHQQNAAKIVRAERFSFQADSIGIPGNTRMLTRSAARRQ